MPYSFKIVFPSNPIVTLCAPTKNEADNMERALITLQADYVIVGPNSIGGSFQMNPAAHQVLDRLAPRQENCGSEREFVRGAHFTRLPSFCEGR
jgi:hypothetical protein